MINRLLRLWWLSLSLCLLYGNKINLINSIATAKSNPTSTALPQLGSLKEPTCDLNDLSLDEWRQERAEKDPHTLYQLAIYYYKQRVKCASKEDYQQLLQQIVQWLTVAAQQGHVEAQRYLASLYIDELNELPQGIYWLEQAATQQSPEAKFILSAAYNYGEGVTQNRSKSFNLLKESAQLGYLPAQFELALFYQNGDNDEKPDLTQAAYWYKIAAQQGLGVAQFNLGLFYQDGLGVPQDITTAIYWFEQAAEQNNSDAQNNLGALYENGKGIPSNLILAEKWYKKAAEQGDSVAQSNLGILYLKHYHTLAIDSGLIQAYAWLGTAIYNGNYSATLAKQNAFYQLPLTQLASAHQLMEQYIQYYSQTE